jgi:hypothetical protein
MKSNIDVSPHCFCKEVAAGPVVDFEEIVNRALRELYPLSV